jgi:hypothetical protein
MVYRVPVGKGHCDIDAWLVDMVREAGEAAAVDFVSYEIAAYRGLACPEG